MSIKYGSIVLVLFLTTLLLSGCNLPSRQAIQAQTPTANSITPISTPTPSISLCDNQYFPNIVGDSWEYSGNNTAIGAYTRTDVITASNGEAVTVQSKLSNVTYSMDYTCSDAGITVMNPIQQYLGALLMDPNSPVNVNLITNSGISLPAKINPGDNWQQSADWEASAKDISTNGRLVLNYTAVGYESITVPGGTFNALRVNATIQIEISGFRIVAGTYTTSLWMAPNVGIIKSEGTSHIPGVDFTDSQELTKFISSP